MSSSQNASSEEGDKRKDVFEQVEALKMHLLEVGRIVASNFLETLFPTFSAGH